MSDLHSSDGYIGRNHNNMENKPKVTKNTSAAQPAGKGAGSARVVRVLPGEAPKKTAVQKSTASSPSGQTPVKNPPVKTAPAEKKPEPKAPAPEAKSAPKQTPKPEVKSGEAKKIAKKPTVKHNFRTEGRTGAEAYKRLYSKENARPKNAKTAGTIAPAPSRPAPQRRAQAYNQARVQSQQNSRRKYSGSVGKKLGGFAGTLEKKAKQLYAAAPEPVHRAGDKLSETAQTVRAWKYTGLVSRAVLLAAVIAFLCVGADLSRGARALERSGAYQQAMDDYACLLAYDPDGEAPERGVIPPKTRAVVSGSDVSAADMDLSDSDIVFSVVSESDMIKHTSKWSDRSAQIKMLLAAGRNEKKAKRRDIKLYAVAEAGAEKFTPSNFAVPGNDDVSYVVSPTKEQLRTPGCYTLRVESGGKETNVLLFVTDTTAPAFTLRDVSVWIGDRVKPSMFLETVTEYSDIIVSYDGKAPDMQLAGEQLVYINVTDIYGNKSEMKAAKLNVQTDTEPPVIAGAKNQNVVIGTPVSYKTGITLTDNRDKPEDITLKIDTGKVKPNEKGTYPVTYTAVDKAGNAASVTVNFRFGTEEELSTDVSLDEYVTKIAKSIFKDGMTQAQQVKAIYNWCRSKIAYSGHSKKDGWKNAAIRGFKSRSGDCYTYFACSKALMEYCGIKNIDVEKVRVKDSESHHYWSLVDVGSGYYHFDATPRVGGFNGFMRTDAQLSDYSKSHKNSHRFDSGKYPATPKDKFSM